MPMRSWPNPRASSCASASAWRAGSENRAGIGQSSRTPVGARTAPTPIVAITVSETRALTHAGLARGHQDCRVVIGVGLVVAVDCVDAAPVESDCVVDAAPVELDVDAASLELEVDEVEVVPFVAATVPELVGVVVPDVYPSWPAANWA